MVEVIIRHQVKADGKGNVAKLVFQPSDPHQTHGCEAAIFPIGIAAGVIWIVAMTRMVAVIIVPSMVKTCLGANTIDPAQLWRAQGISGMTLIQTRKGNPVPARSQDEFHGCVFPVKMLEGKSGGKTTPYAKARGICATAPEG